MFGSLFLGILLVTGADWTSYLEGPEKVTNIENIISLNIKICITYIQRFKQIAMLCYIATHHTTLRLDHVLTCNTELTSNSILSMSSVL